MKNVKTFDQILDEKYGKKGNTERDQFDADSLAFRLGVMLKEARVEANLTQEKLARKNWHITYLLPLSREVWIYSTFQVYRICRMP